MAPTTLCRLLLLAAAILPLRPAAAAELWYDQAAQAWMTHALPIGNGRVGAMFFGGIGKERRQPDRGGRETRHRCRRITREPVQGAGWQILLSRNVSGLRARGGFRVDLEWKDSKLTSAVIHSLSGTSCEVRHGTTVTRLNLKPGEHKEL